jgi:4-hydroxybenzoate polyprenyltransferase
VPNLFILAFTQYSTRVFLIGPKEGFYKILLEPKMFFICLCTILVAAAGYIINDYYDIKIDMVNKPGRVVISKYISRRMALVLHPIINGVAITLAYFMLSINVSLFITGCAFLLWLYSNYLKRTAFWGNLSIAFLAFATLFMLGLFYKQNMELILVFGFFAFATTLIREVIKDVEDIRGDMLYGCRTLPIVIGIKRTKFVILFLLGATFVSILFTYSFVNNLAYFYLVIFTTLPLLYETYKITKAERKKDFHYVSTVMKVIMVAGISGMIFV